ncbi:hypothetical protein [Acidipropionibacterium timonense]|uniref:hypothetical protein n=1 Tax=Acidipropionibacterium timonense TaxID=2161818 RepID=UPI0010325F15|nr:hypothetical protein [Acidipropionibacterium timonense]
MDDLTFVESTLPPDGNGRRGQYLDLVVGGASLRSSIGEDLLVWASTPLQSGWDLESGLTWLTSLSRGRQVSLPAGRVALYVCRECGDLGCGALSVNIERCGSVVRWTQFGWEDDLDDKPWSAIEFPLEFTFQASAYDQTLRAARERVLASQSRTAPTGHLWWRKPGFVAIDL